MINALAFSGSNFFYSIGYLENQLIKSERDMIKHLKICNELRLNGKRKDNKNDWITLIIK